jgi:DNA-binding transcriptional LysR family regulator
MSLPLDDLPSMALFAQVVQLRSFSAAAREAGLVKSAVSKRIAALEARIGLRLLVRTSRRLAPTSEGLAFYEHCAALCAAARAAVDSIGDARSARGIVRVNASGAFAALYLARAVALFLARHPGIDVHFLTDDRLVDLAESGADIVVRVSRKLRGSAVVRRIATDRMHVVASPAYLARAGTPESPADLVQHNCLRYGLMPADEEWQFEEDGRRMGVPIASNLVASDPAVLRGAVLAGVGLSSLPGFLVARDIAAGRLVSVLHRYVNIPLGIYVLMSHRTQLPERTRLLVDFLARHFAKADWAALADPSSSAAARSRPRNVQAARSSSAAR